MRTASLRPGTTLVSVYSFVKTFELFASVTCSDILSLLCAATTTPLLWSGICLTGLDGFCLTSREFVSGRAFSRSLDMLLPCPVSLSIYVFVVLASRSPTHHSLLLVVMVTFFFLFPPEDLQEGRGLILPHFVRGRLPLLRHLFLL